MIYFDVSLDAVDDSGRTALMAAAYNGVEEMVDYLIQHGANIERTDHEGLTALHYAAEGRRNSDSIVRALLSHDCKVDRRDFKSRTPLVLALDSDVNTVRLLLEKGASPDTLLTNGRTPLMHAVSRGSIELTRVLLEHKAQVDVQLKHQPAGWSAMMFATSLGHDVILQMLIDVVGAQSLSQPTKAGSRLINLIRTEETLRVILQYPKWIDLNHQDANGNTLLHLSIDKARACQDMYKLLINGGADLNIQNQRGLTPLMMAVMINEKKIVRLLLAQPDINPDIQSAKYGGALQQAAEKCNFDILKMLIEAGADPNPYWDGYVHYATPLQTACMERRQQCRRNMAKYLIENGANVNLQGGSLGSALSAAAHRGDLNIISLLLDKGASTYICDALDRTPIHFSTSDYDGFRAILKAGGNVKVKDKLGRTPLHWAAAAGQPKVIAEILSKVGSAAVDEPDIDGWTPIMWATRAANLRDRKAVIRLLLSKGASRSVQGQVMEHTWSLQRIAAYSRAGSIVRMLLKYGLHYKTVSPSPSDSDDEELQRTNQQHCLCDACFWVSLKILLLFTSKCASR